MRCLEPNFVYEVKGVKAMGRRTSEGFVLLKEANYLIVLVRLVVIKSGYNEKMLMIWI